MADPKVTKMVMNVDLQCYKCFRKIKKVLCCCPQIRDQEYDVKQNTVTITVVCCSPEKIMERIACKAGDTVESIKILPDKTKKKVTFVEPVKEAAKPPEQAPPPAPASKAPAPIPAPVPAPAPAPKMQKPSLALAPALLDPILQGYPQLTPTGPVPMYPGGMCCCCHEGGPCYHGNGQAQMWYNGYAQPAAYNFQDRNQGYYVNRCDYFSEENASGCSIM